MRDIETWFMGRIKTVHFVGIGGIGMSGLAEILLRMGFNVRGSDMKDSPAITHLRDLGASIAIGHRSENLGDADVLVYSSAVPHENPELQAAQQAKIPIIRRAELLAEMMRLKNGIAIAGTHGKTTTTSLVAIVLEHAGLEPTIVVGGNANNIGTNARIGEGPYFVAEADESDESFLLLTPNIAVVTNIEEEHLDHYSGLPHILQTFSRFLNKVPFFGAAIVWGDDPNISGLLEGYSRTVITYGEDEKNTLVFKERFVSDLSQSFKVFYRNEFWGDCTIAVPGKHMVLNSLAAIAVGIELNIPSEKIIQGLANYRGVKRRMDVKRCSDDVIVLDDYAHHPTEIEVTITAIRESWDRKLTAVFQPHRYSRTQFFFNRFAEVLSKVDRLLILPVYAASETPIDGVDAAGLVALCRAEGLEDVVYVASIQDACEYLLPRIESGEIIATFGAGTVFQVGELIRKSLGELQDL